MKMMPLISIVVPVYNVEVYVAKCIESILKQTYSNLEIILVDDGSTDYSGKICDEYASKDNRIIVIHKANEGVSSARNVGIENAKGEYIAFVDPDDYIEINMMEVLLASITNNSSSISICGYIIEPSNTIQNFSVQGNKYVKYGYEVTQDILNDYFPKSFPWNKLYKKDLFNEIRYPQNRVYEDIATTYKLTHKAQIISFVPSALYHYVLRKGNITSELSSSKAAQSYFDATITQYEILKFVESHNIYIELKSKIIDSIKRFSREYCRQSCRNSYMTYIESINRLNRIVDSSLLEIPRLKLLFYFKTHTLFIFKRIYHKLRK